jgi:hypothetical protein
VTTATQSTTAKAPRQPNKLAGEGGWTFRAPRQGDLVVCPYCDADTFTCDHCGGERRLYANEVFQ